MVQLEELQEALLQEALEAAESKLMEDGNESPQEEPAPAAELLEEDDEEDELEEFLQGQDLVIVADNEEDDDEEEYTDDEEEESVLDRIKALSDAIPLSVRFKVWDSVEKAVGWGFNVGRFIGTAAWIFTTGAMVLVLPAAFELEKEQAAIMQENQIRMQQQQAQQIMQQQNQSN